MRVAVSFGVLVAFATLATGLDTYAQAPAAAPAATNTLWHFLGIPQGIQKLKDATKNKNGNHPERERKPPLKRIGDPANLESQNPAIKAAAKVKTEEDLAPQKIKAIKYLATIGCGCYPGVKEALLAALDDCTEEVRYQAAIALCEAAGNHCERCGKTCCNVEVMNKLEEKAHGQDASGCFKESSSRVRAAAENALNACKRKVPPGAAPAETPTHKELPLQPTPAIPNPPSGIEAPMPQDSQAPRPINGASYRPDRGQPIHVAGYSAAADSRPDAESGSTIGFAEVKDGNEGTPGDEMAMARRPRWCPPCPCPRLPGETAPSETAPSETTPPSPLGEEATPPSNALAGNYGAASGPASSAPNMIGDFFGGGARFFGAGALRERSERIGGNRRRRPQIQDRGGRESDPHRSRFLQLQPFPESPAGHRRQRPQSGPVHVRHRKDFPGRMVVRGASRSVFRGLQLGAILGPRGGTVRHGVWRSGHGGQTVSHPPR